jgi:hypothetical protein
MAIQNVPLQIVELVITLLTSFAASSGFWLFIAKKNEVKDLSRKLLIGLAHDRIVCLSLKYIELGQITQDEYENLCEYLYTPYIEMGGNGAVKRLMQEVDKLPIIPNRDYSKK